MRVLNGLAAVTPAPGGKKDAAPALLEKMTACNQTVGDPMVARSEFVKGLCLLPPTGS